MSNVKKIIGVVLALVMALSCFTVAFAAEGDQYQIAISAPASVNAGETATVEVKVTSNYPVSAMSIPVFFDKSKVEVVSASAAEDIDGATVAGQGIYTEVSKYYTDSGLSQDDYDVRALNYVAGYGATIKQYANEVVMTVVIKAKANASGNTLVTFGNTMKTSTNLTGTLYVAKNSSEGTQVDSKGELIDAGTLENATITINGSSADPADLELTAKGTADGVKIDTRITFGGQYAGAVYGFNQAAPGTFRSNSNYITDSVQATNGGDLVIERSFNTVGWSTGTTITVKNSDGSDSGKVYMVVIFGDVNYDGLINNADITAVKSYSLSEAKLTSLGKPKALVVRMAANCQKIANSTMLYRVNNADITAAKAYVLGTSTKVSQADLAATIYGLASVYADYQ